MATIQPPDDALKYLHEMLAELDSGRKRVVNYSFDFRAELIDGVPIDNWAISVPTGIQHWCVELTVEDLAVAKRFNEEYPGVVPGLRELKEPLSVSYDAEPEDVNDGVNDAELAIGVIVRVDDGIRHTCGRMLVTWDELERLKETSGFTEEQIVDRAIEYCACTAPSLH